MRPPSGRSLVCCSLLLLAAPATPRAEMVAVPIELGDGIRLPAVCSDGKRLVYTKNMNGPGGPELFVKDLSDTAAPAVRLTDSPRYDGGATWSPDCSRVAFMSGRSGNEDIWVYDFAADRYTQMTFSPWGDGIRAQEWGPVWSPDGTRIALSSDRSWDDDIWWIPAEGGEMVRVTKRTLPRTRDQDRFPSWSPDGKRIIYSSKSTGNWDLWETSVDDTSAAPTQLTSDPTDEFRPAWSPNGRWIAFVSNRAGNLDLFVLPAQGGEPIQLTQNPNSDSEPCWSPDGRNIYYTGFRPEGSGIWMIDGLAELLGADYAATR